MNLNKIFTSHMVFPALVPVRVYGEGSGIVKISFAGHSVAESFDSTSWFIELPPMEYGGPYEMRVNLNGEEQVLTDVYIGEVFLFSGQSNMQFKLGDSTTPKERYESTGNLRFLVADRLEEGEPYSSNDGWIVSNADIAGNFSALAHLVSQEISEKNNIAVGALCCYQGASVIESWVPAGAFKKIGINLLLEQKRPAHYCKEYSAWNGEGCLYENMLSQVTPYPVSAVVWYQGEADATYEEGEVYAKELALLIDIWRRDFKNPELPFIIVQLADFESGCADLEGWKRVQQAQMEIIDNSSNVKSVKCADICENFDLHPPTKDKLAHRIAEALSN